MRGKIGNHVPTRWVFFFVCKPKETLLSDAPLKVYKLTYSLPKTYMFAVFANVLKCSKSLLSRNRILRQNLSQRLERFLGNFKFFVDRFFNPMNVRITAKLAVDSLSIQVMMREKLQWFIKACPCVNSAKRQREIEN